jgi:hypothetical protein
VLRGRIEAGPGGRATQDGQDSKSRLTTEAKKL